MSKEHLTIAAIVFVVVIGALWVSAKYLHINSFDEFEEVK